MSCIQCGTAMTGRKRKYCNKTCGRHASREREKADGRKAALRKRQTKSRQRWLKDNPVTRQCIACGEDFPVRMGEPTKTCSRDCLNLRSAVRTAYENGDHRETISAIKDQCIVTPGGCWEWQPSDREYPRICIGPGNKARPVHRISLEAHHGALLGAQAAHHKCANTRCVNPDHLQPVTAVENNAEMMARQYMLGRIADLEKALATHEPNHPLLAEIGVTNP